MSTGWETFKQILIAFCSSILSTISFTALCAFLLVYTVAQPICNWTILQGALIIIPIILDIAGIAIAFTGVGIPITGILLIISTIMEVVSSVCDFANGQWLSLVLSVLGWTPLIGVVPQMFRGIWKVIT